MAKVTQNSWSGSRETCEAFELGTGGGGRGRCGSIGDNPPFQGPGGLSLAPLGFTNPAFSHATPQSRGSFSAFGLGAGGAARASALPCLWRDMCVIVFVTFCHSVLKGAALAPWESRPSILEAFTLLPVPLLRDDRCSGFQGPSCCHPLQGDSVPSLLLPEPRTPQTADTLFLNIRAAP